MKAHTLTKEALGSLGFRPVVQHIAEILNHKKGRSVIFRNCPQSAFSAPQDGVEVLF